MPSLNKTNADDESVTGVTSGLFENKDKLFEVHTHSRENSAKGASVIGNAKDGYMWCYMADISRDYKNRSNHNQLPQPPHYIYHKYTKNIHYYTPWKSSIFIKKATSTNSLFFFI